MGDRHRAAGLALADHLAAEAHWEQQEDASTGREPRWTGPELVGDERQWRIVDAVTGPGLYAGASGIALALAAASRVDGDPRRRQAAVTAARSALVAGVELAEVGRLDLAAGSSGIAHAVAWVGVLAECPDVLDGARELARLTAQRLQDAPADPDFLSGTAGAIVALLSTDPADPVVRAGATSAARGLADMAHDDLIGVMWPAPEAPDGLGLLGLAHGTSGTSLALLTAAAHGAREVQDLGWTAWDRERSWFDVREGNWPDLRVVGPGSEPSASRPSMVAWCHGALGIGCARLRLLHLHPDSPRRLALLAEVSVAVEAGRRKVMTARAALRDGTGTDASLCHGLTGVTELLLSASTLDGGASHARAAERVGDAVLAQHEQLGRWPCGLPAPHDEDPLEPPGLFLGLAGIALGLLRLGTGANVPGAALPQPIPGRSTSSSPPNPW